MKLIRRIFKVIKFSIYMCIIGAGLWAFMEAEARMSSVKEQAGELLKEAHGKIALLEQELNGQQDIDYLLAAKSQEKGISPVVASIILEKESGNQGMSAIRFEAHHMSRARKITKNPEQQRMYASSHCALQIMGWHAPSYGLTWSDLYSPEVCVEVGLDIFKKCMERHANKGKADQIWSAAKCYNGADSYANDFVRRLGNKLIEEMV